MRKFIVIFVVLCFAARLSGEEKEPAPAEVPPGVIAAFQSPGSAGFTTLAVAGSERILLGTSRGGLWQWNPKTGDRSELRSGGSKNAPVLNLTALRKNRYVLRADDVLERGNPAANIHDVRLPPLAKAALSPTGRAFAGIGEEPPLRFFSAETGKQTHRSDRQVDIDEMRYSTSGRFLATSRYGRLYLWNSETGDLVWKARLEGNLQGFVFAPDENAIFAAAAREGIWEIDRETGKVKNRLARVNALDDGEARHRLAFSPDGRLLAEVQLRRQIAIWEIATGRTVLTALRHQGEITALEFLPEGFRLVSADTSGRAYVWDLSHASFAEPFDVSKPYSEEDQNQLWRMLGEPRGRMAWTAMIALWHRPEEALEFIDNPPNDDELIRELIGDLDHDLSTERQAAFRALKQLSLKAEPYLKTAIRSSKSAELTARIRRLLAYLSGPSRRAQLELLRESQNHRQLRLIQLLRWIGTSQAKQRLIRIHRSTSDPSIQQQAEEAIDWIEKSHETMEKIR